MTVQQAITSNEKPGWLAGARDLAAYIRPAAIIASVSSDYSNEV
jgi:hypothetical protein